MNSLIILTIIYLNLITISPQNNLISSFIELDKKTISPDNKIQGKMIINEESYTAICSCNEESEDKNSLIENNKDAKCDPSKLTIQNEIKGKGASLNSVRNLIGDALSLTYVPIEKSSFKCLDGRYNKPVLSTTGGDSGEFILALNIFEDLLNEYNINNNINKTIKLNQNDIDFILYKYINFSNSEPFYMCTDDNAINHIEKELQIEGLNFINPRDNIKNDLFDLITKTENIGDLHIKLMLKYPEKYGIRKEIIEMFLKSFYNLYWNNKNIKDKMELDILSGDHNENAFIEVRSENECQKEKIAPLIPTQDKYISVFVHHLDAVSIKRKKIAEFFSDKSNTNFNGIDSDIMHKRLDHHGYAILDITGGFIAKGLPFDTINVA